MGWVIEVGPLFIVGLYPIWSIYRLYQSGARGEEMARRLFSPTASWYNTERGGKEKVGEEEDEEVKKAESDSDDSDYKIAP